MRCDMCIKCSEAVQEAVKNGVSEKTAIDWLWENTAFPVGDPTEEEYANLRKLQTL